MSQISAALLTGQKCLTVTQLLVPVIEGQSMECIQCYTVCILANVVARLLLCTEFYTIQYPLVSQENKSFARCGRLNSIRYKKSEQSFLF